MSTLPVSSSTARGTGPLFPAVRAEDGRLLNQRLEGSNEVAMRLFGQLGNFLSSADFWGLAFVSVSYHRAVKTVLNQRVEALQSWLSQIAPESRSRALSWRFLEAVLNQDLHLARALLRKGLVPKAIREGSEAAAEAPVRIDLDFFRLMMELSLQNQSLAPACTFFGRDQDLKLQRAQLALLSAAETGNLPAIEAISKIPGVRFEQETLDNALHGAARSGNPLAIEKILNISGARFEQEILDWALLGAAESGNPLAIEKIRNIPGAQFEQEALDRANLNTAQSRDPLAIEPPLNIPGAQSEQLELDGSLLNAARHGDPLAVGKILNIPDAQFGQETLNEALSNATRSGDPLVVEKIRNIPGAQFEQETLNEALSNAARSGNPRAVAKIFSIPGARFEQGTLDGALQSAFDFGMFAALREIRRISSAQSAKELDLSTLREMSNASSSSFRQLIEEMIRSFSLDRPSREN